MLAALVEIVLDGAVGHSPLIPKSPDISAWLRGTGIGERLGYRVFLIALIAFSGAYAGILALVGRAAKGRGSADGGQGSATTHIPVRWAIGLVGALQVIVFLGPILISTDVFSYIAYARMGVVHGVNPYTHGPRAILGDPVYRYVGNDWKHVATAYGPLYTLLSYPLAPLGVVGAVWGMKLYALLTGAGTLLLTWRGAARRGLDPVFALLAVGANPLWVIYGLGGAHNDLIMTFLMMGAVSFALVERDIEAGATVMAGTLVKATAAALLPFMVLARLRMGGVGGVRGLALGIVGALALATLAALAAFGVHGIDIVAALNRDAAFVSTDSFPTEVAHLFGKPGVFPVDHALLKLGLGMVVVYLLACTWRGYDWVAASGWTLLAITVTSSWLLAWYTLWPLPLAAIVRDRRLLCAILAVQVLFVVHQISPLLAPVT
ncbi:MAG TPA: glycosyltransferase 87 family protein [Solirubrobacteraceae bacterium]|jgi:hypothetical protein|nr:glycosyltransferase 87 family protein [Solirubrobacteraceae bacterium]